MKNAPAIPDEVMIPACNGTLREYPGHCADNWGELQKSVCRSKCGSDYALIETDWIGHRAICLRKQGLLVSVNGGPKRKKYAKPSGRYQEYLDGTHWKEFRLSVIDFWDGYCCLCRAPATEVHHNTYERKGIELLTDCVPLCRACHMRVHSILPDGNEILNRHDLFED